MWGRGKKFSTLALLILLLLLGEQLEPNFSAAKSKKKKSGALLGRRKKKKTEKNSDLHPPARLKKNPVNPHSCRRRTLGPRPPTRRVESSTLMEAPQSIPTLPSRRRHFRCASDEREPVFAQYPPPPHVPPSPHSPGEPRRRHRILSYNLHLSFLDHTLR